MTIWNIDALDVCRLQGEDKKLTDLIDSLIMSALGKVMLKGDRNQLFYIFKFTTLFESIKTSIATDWTNANGVEAARRLARHLPSPYLDGEGLPVVPELTRRVLSDFESDERTFQEFCAGTHSLELMVGDIAGQYDQYANVASKFLAHPLRRIREWAQYEIKSANSRAQSWRDHEEDRDD
ncbi:MAG: hypothetical protein EOO70_02160 [Myxococcaceae bacterium]|nr:MAG: hypothetical protein EOO70_02160 [Myxococcaceae bacterium]